jgi:oligosaccharide repeat unit polymerase
MNTTSQQTQKPAKPVPWTWISTLVICGLIGLQLTGAVPLVLGITICLATLIIIDRTSGLFYWLDPASLFIIGYFVFILIGTLFFGWFDLETYWMTNIVSLVGLLFFVAGLILRDLLSSPPGRLRIRRQAVISGEYSKLSLAALILAWLFGNALVTLYFLRLGYIPLLVSDAESVRAASISGQAFIPILGYAFISVASIGFALHIARANMWQQLIVGVVITIGIVMLLGVGYRGLAMKVFLVSFIAYCFTRYRRLPIVWLGIAGVFLFVLLAIVGYYRLTGQLINSWEAVELMLRRVIWTVFVRYLFVYDLTIAHFAQNNQLLLGESYLMTFATALPGPQEHFGYWLRDELGLILTAPGPVDPTIVGEFFVNFRWLGVTLGMFLVGFFLRSIYLFVRGTGVIDSHQAMFLIVLSVSIISVVTSGIASVLVYDLAPLMFVVFLISLTPLNTRSKEE